MKKRKKWFILLLIFILFISLSLVLENIAYSNSNCVCGKITRKSSIKGAWSIYYNFRIDGNSMEGGISSSLVKDISFDSLKKIDCVKIQYSKYWSFFNKIVDSRILK